MENSTTLDNNQNLPSRDQIDHRINTIRTYLERVEPFGFSGTVLIARGQNILIDQGIGYMDYEHKISMTSDAILSIGSISKQFTSTIILQLQEQGKLSVDDSLVEFFDNVPEDKANITIHQLLTHTSGLPSAIGGDFEEISTTDFIDQVLEIALEFKPGSDFSYSNVGYSVAAIIAQKIGGQSYNSLLRTIFDDLGITSASWFGDPQYNQENSVSYYVDGERRGSVYDWPGSWNSERPYWHILGNGGITINHHDMHTYLTNLFSGEIISPSSLDMMLESEKNDYGYGWDIIDSPLGTVIQHDGGSSEGVSSICRYFRDLDLYLLISSNTMINSFGMAFVVDNVIEKLLIGEEVVIPPEIENIHDLPHPEEFNLQGYNGSDLLISKSKNTPLMVQVNGQQLLNKIMNNDRTQVELYKDMNRITQEFGLRILNEQWQDAFQLTKRKGDYERRVKILGQLRSAIETEHGSVTSVEVGGTIPYPGYLAMTLLLFVTEEGHKAGIPVIWNKPDEILGFRPLLAKYTLTLFAVYDGDEIIGYSPDLNKIVKLRTNTSDRSLIIESN